MQIQGDTVGPVSTPYAVVVGGANLDVVARSTAALVPATSNPGTATSSPGGVGRNIAENLARLGSAVHLVAVVGDDPFGGALLRATAAAGVGVEHVRRGPQPTGTYTAVLDAGGELAVAVADMAATESLSAADVRAAAGLLAGAALLVLDANLAPGTLAAALDLATAAGVPVVLEPVSVPKADRARALLQTGRPLLAVTPNRDELAVLAGLPTGTPATVAAAALHAQGVQHVWVHRGEDGSTLSTAGARRVHLRPRPVDPVDVTGAGDAMVAGFCHGLLTGLEPVEAARFGQAAAELTVTSAGTVRPDLTAALVHHHLETP